MYICQLQLKTPNGLTDAFLTLIGVLRGDHLAPLLLIIVLEYNFLQSMIEDNELTLIHLIPTEVLV